MVYKQLPEGYAEVLENTQVTLVTTVHKLYSMVRNSDPWTLGEPEQNDRGQPVIHSIAQKLGCIQESRDIDLPTHSIFPEDEPGMEELARQLKENQPSQLQTQGDDQSGNEQFGHNDWVLPSKFEDCVEQDHRDELGSPARSSSIETLGGNNSVVDNLTTSSSTPTTTTANYELTPQAYHGAIASLFPPPGQGPKDYSFQPLPSMMYQASPLPREPPPDEPQPSPNMGWTFGGWDFRTVLKASSGFELDSSMGESDSMFTLI